ncbi:MAG: DUF2207 domain-containing protein, partial [Patescibacteria group bacterium]
MLKRITILLIVGIFILNSLPVFGQEDFLNQEKINDFKVNININKNGSFLIEESIIYDFGENLKHGIFRDIPLGNTKIKILEVTDELNNPYIFETSREG